jgi:hypothetical protein
MDEITLFLSMLIIGLASILFIVSSLSSYRLRNFKFFLISFAFLAFILKGFLLIFEFISQDKIGLIIDVVIIILLYFAIVKK